MGRWAERSDWSSASPGAMPRDERERRASTAAQIGDGEHGRLPAPRGTVRRSTRSGAESGISDQMEPDEGNLGFPSSVHIQGQPELQSFLPSPTQIESQWFSQQ